jgi:hypothetical protein
VALRQSATLLASDGLSDPFPKGKGPEDKNGFGLELYAITPDKIEGDIGQSWLYNMVAQTSQLAAHRGDLEEVIAKGGPFTAELYHVAIPTKYRATYVNEEKRVGVIIGLEEASVPAEIEGRLSKIRLVSVKLLTLKELAFARDENDEKFSDLLKKLAQSGATSSLERKSVV